MNNYKKAIIMPLALSGILYADNAYSEKVDIGGEIVEIEEEPAQGTAPKAVVKPNNIATEETMPEEIIVNEPAPTLVKPAKKTKTSSSPFIDSFLFDADARFLPGSYEANSKAQSGASFLPATSSGSQTVLYSRVVPGLRFLRHNEVSLPVEIRSTSASLENEIDTVGKVGKSDVSESDISFGAQYKRIFPWKNIDFSANAGIGYRKSSGSRKGPHDILFIEQTENASGLEYSAGAGIDTEKVAVEIIYRKAATSGEAKSDVSIPSFNMTLPTAINNYERESGLLRLEAIVNLHKWAKFAGRIEFEDLLRAYDNSGVKETSDERLKRIELGWLSPDFHGFSAGVYGGMSNSSGFSSAKKSDETSNGTYIGGILTYHLDTGKVTSTAYVPNTAKLSSTVLEPSSTSYGASEKPAVLSPAAMSATILQPAAKKPIRKTPAKRARKKTK